MSLSSTIQKIAFLLTFVKRELTVFLILCQAGTTLHAQHGKVDAWLQDKFSMFIHFGLYSHFGGVWQGNPVTRGYSEQIQSHGGIHSDLYAGEAANFNPSHWNADSIVSLAKQAGMRSIVITSKHHDGFCMFDTQTTDFNIVDATPFGSDVLKELSEACERGGLNFGLYFSLIDWHYPQAYPISSHNADFITPEHHNYNKAQLKELLSNYGPISELWFDMGSLSYTQSKELRDLVHQYQPDCLVSGRLGNDQGDFCVMGDNQYPEYQLAVPWQVPASVYDETWGHRSWQRKDPIEEKVAEKIRSLVQTAARGGNYLLNIGPDAHGAVTAHEREVLEGIGKWMSINAPAIYGVVPVKSAEDQVLLAQKGNQLYAYLFDTSVNQSLILPGINAGVQSIVFLDAPEEPVAFTHQNGDLEIQGLKDSSKSTSVRVLRIILDTPYQTPPSTGISFSSNLMLSATNGEPEYSFSGVDYYSSYRSTVGYRWQVRTKATAQVIPELYYTPGDSGKQITLSWNGQATPIELNGGIPQALSKIKTEWGRAYLNGPHPGFIDTPIANPADAALGEPWGGQSWTPIDESVDSDTLKLPASMFRNWYLLQEVTASKSGEVLVRVPTNDGVAIYLNGNPIYIGNNPLKEAHKFTEVVLPLQKGKNTLLVKAFNRFNTSVKLGVEVAKDQVVYRKRLPEQRLRIGEANFIELNNSPEVPIHRVLEVTRVKISLQKN